MDFLTIFKDYGLSVAALIVIGWFLFREIWPWIKTKTDEATADRRQERDKFLQALHYLTSVTETQALTNQQTLAQVTTQMHELTDSVGQVAGAVQRLYDKVAPK